MEFSLRKVAGVFLLLWIGSMIGDFYQNTTDEQQMISKEETIVELQESNQKYKEEIERLKNEETNVDSSNLDEYVEQMNLVENFITGYFTFDTKDLSSRLKSVTPYITKNLKENMEKEFTEIQESANGDSHYDLIASNVKVFQGSAGDYLATFYVKYESEFEEDSTIIYVMEFKVSEDKISEFEIKSVQDKRVMEFESKK